MKRSILLSFLVSILFAPLVMASEAGKRLDHFFLSVQSLTAEFTQEVMDDKGTLIHQAAGTFTLLRPGRFRWDYTHPNEQSIISDGQYLWIYDVELAQVTVKKLGEALGASPIMLLAEPRSMNEDFILIETREAGELAWVELAPKARDTDFTRIDVGLDQQTVREMKLKDQFGQKTRIRFDKVTINPPVSQRLFHFEIPAGVDVIGLDPAAQN
jgi:outer membrane lipoprotein carrier protein